MLVIPKTPKVLRLPIGRLWNGERSPDTRISAMVEIRKEDKGVFVRATSKLLGAAAENPDYFSVFFVEEGGQYLEVKIEVGGRYSISGFDAPRQKVADFKETPVLFTHTIDKSLGAINEITIPFEIFPSNLSAINAFFVSGKHSFAYHPLSGAEVDFHQPNLFPLAKLEE